jgi:hypothetical protein
MAASPRSAPSLTSASESAASKVATADGAAWQQRDAAAIAIDGKDRQIGIVAATVDPAREASTWSRAAVTSPSSGIQK